MIGTSARPLAVSVYSTRGGTSGNVSRATMPSSSSARRRRRERAGRDALERAFQLAEARLVLGEVADHQERPWNPGYEPHSPAGRELTVGRIYRPPAPASLGHEPHSPAGRELTWFWSITVPVDPKFRIRTHGHAETLERAHAEFQANWDAQSR